MFLPCVEPSVAGAILTYIGTLISCQRCSQKNIVSCLLYVLVLCRTILAVPIVDGINWDTMAYYPVYDHHHHRGIYEWGLLYKEGLVPEQELNKRKYPSEPYK